MLIDLLVLLLWLVLFAIVVYGVIYVLEAIFSFTTPPKILKLIWIAVALICLIYLVSYLGGVVDIPVPKFR